MGVIHLIIVLQCVVARIDKHDSLVGADGAEGFGIVGVLMLVEEELFGDQAGHGGRQGGAPLPILALVTGPRHLVYRQGEVGWPFFARPAHNHDARDPQEVEGLENDASASLRKRVIEHIDHSEVEKFCHAETESGA